MDGTLWKDLSRVREGIGSQGSRQIRFQDGPKHNNPYLYKFFKFFFVGLCCHSESFYFLLKSFQLPAGVGFS